MGRPPYRGRYEGGVQHVRIPLQPPQNAEASENIQMHRGVGGHMGVSTPLRGVQMYRGVWMYRGFMNIGASRHPQV